jgi:hypothetical protein
MGMMLLRINLNYHAYKSLVYPILFQFPSLKSVLLQEDNDQAFPVTL